MKLGLSKEISNPLAEVWNVLFQFIPVFISMYTLAFYTFDYINIFYLYLEYKYFPVPLDLVFQRSFFFPIASVTFLSFFT